MAKCYQRLHSPKQSEQAIDAVINDIVQSLFCVIATLQTIPIIRAQTGGWTQMVGEKLCSKLSTHLKDRNANLFRASGQSVYQNRPLLILLERSIDFAMPLHHSPIYQSLLHDLLALKCNHVEIASDGKTQRVFLDHENDDFWRQNAAE